MLRIRTILPHSHLDFLLVALVGASVLPAFALVNIGNTGLQLGLFIASLVMAGYGFQVLVTCRLRRLNKVDAWWVIFVAWSGVSIVLSTCFLTELSREQIPFMLNSWIVLAVGGVVYFAVRLLVTSVARLELASEALVWIAVVSALFGIVQVVAVQFGGGPVYILYNNASFALPARAFNLNRAFGFTSEPSHLIGVLLLAFPLSSRSRVSANFRLGIASAILCLGIIATGSASAVFLPVAFILSFVLCRQRIDRRTMPMRLLQICGVTLFIGLLVVILVYLNSIPLLNRVIERTVNALTGGAEDLSWNVRAESFRAGWRLFLDYPLFGVGWNGHTQFVPQYGNFVGMILPSMSGIESVPIGLLAQLGVIGTIPFTGLLFCGFRGAWLAWKQFPRHRALVAGWGIGVLMLLLQFSVSTGGQWPMLCYFHVALAVLASLPTRDMKALTGQ